MKLATPSHSKNERKKGGKEMEAGEQQKTKFCHLCREKTHYTPQCQKEMPVKKRWEIFKKIIYVSIAQEEAMVRRSADNQPVALNVL